MRSNAALRVRCLESRTAIPTLSASMSFPFHRSTSRAQRATWIERRLRIQITTTCKGNCIMNLTKVSLGLSLLALSAAAALAAPPGAKPDADARAELRRAIRSDELPRGESSPPIKYHSSSTREEVKHETAVARADGEMTPPGDAAGSEFPQRVQSVASRVEVKQEFASAKANGELLGAGEASDYGAPSHQAHGVAAAPSTNVFAFLKKGTKAKDGQ